MKKLLPICFCCFALVGKSQSLLDTNNLWINVNLSINLGLYYNFYMLDGDTTIAGKPYIKLFKTYDHLGNPWEYIYGMREDSTGKVFYVLRNSEEEKLLYDFNLQVNDTFLICDRVEAVVSVIDTVTIANGEQRKRIQFDPGPEVWIEGIGSTTGIVSNGGTHYCITIGEVQFFLNCFYNGQTLVYNEEFSPYPCFPVINSLEKDHPFDLKLYPNPFHFTSTLELPKNEHNGQLNIYNFQGMLVQHQLIQGQFTQLTRNTLPNGIYIYQFVNSTGHNAVGKFVLE